VWVAAQQVQRGALGGEERAGGTGDAGEHLPGANARAFLCEVGELDIAGHRVEHRVRHGEPGEQPVGAGGDRDGGSVLGAEDRLGGDVAPGVGEVLVEVVLDGDVHVFGVEAAGEQALVQARPSGHFGETAHAMGSQVVSSSPSELMARQR
jgi:hypothetical protein